MADTMSRVRLLVKGKVQGVFFRQSTRDKAHALGLSGWVKNQDDGSVEVVAVGKRQAVEELIAWCRKGPPSARVDDLVVERFDAAALDQSAGGSFRIAY